MRKIATLVTAVIMAVVTTFALTACGGGGGGDVNKDLKFDKTEVSLKVGDYETLTPMLKGAALGADANVDYLISKDDQKIVSCEGGLLKGLSAGTATVKAQSPSANGLSMLTASCTVKVEADENKICQYDTILHESKDNPKLVTGYAGVYFYKDGKVKLDLLNAGYQGSVTLDYTKDANTVSATLPQDQKVDLKANAYGLQIQAVMGMVGVAMGDTAYVDNVKLEQAANYVTVKGTQYLTLDAYNAKTGEEKLFYSFAMTSEDATKLGITLLEKATVTGISMDNMLDDKTKLDLTAGEQRLISVKVEPDNATIKTYKFSTSDENIAKVDAKGVITAVGAGTATVTVTSDDTQANKSATLTVNVAAPKDDETIVKGSVVDGMPGSYGTLRFKKGEGKVYVDSVYFISAYNFNTAYTVTDGTISLTDCEYTVAGIPMLSIPDKVYTIHFDVTKTEVFTAVSVKATEKDKADAQATEIASVLLSADEIAKL